MKLFFRTVLFFVVSASLHAADPVEFSVGNFSFERPKGWGWVVPTAAMRKAQLSVPGVGESAPGEVTFFHFGAGQGGGVQANVTRWLGQFQDGSSGTRTESVGKTTVTFVQATGTFSSGMPGGVLTPMTGYAMRGAILENPQGDIYIKLTGPVAVVKAAEAAFEEMVKAAAAR